MDKHILYIEETERRAERKYVELIHCLNNGQIKEINKSQRKIILHSGVRISIISRRRLDFVLGQIFGVIFNNAELTFEEESMLTSQVKQEALHG